jgi:hypothetical protein
MNTRDEAKRPATRAGQGLDFADAELVFASRVMTLPDARRIIKNRALSRRAGCVVALQSSCGRRAATARRIISIPMSSPISTPADRGWQSRINEALRKAAGLVDQGKASQGLLRRPSPGGVVSSRRTNCSQQQRQQASRIARRGPAACSRASQSSVASMNSGC